MNANYFDHAATTPVDPHVVAAMLPYLTEGYGNANSLHSWGRQARDAVERARERVAALIHAGDSSEIVFTSGATEGNNWVVRAHDDVAISPFEHSSVREPALALGKQILGNRGGYELEWGTAHPRNGRFDLVAIMAVNNETGAILPVGIADQGDTMHCDATQAIGKIPFRATETQYASMSAHKFYGPKGIGALYIEGGHFMEPLLFGGEHEDGRRGGTLNVPGIVGMGEAALIAADRQPADFAHARSLRQLVLNELESLSDWQENRGEGQSPFILSLSFAGVEGETLVIEADHRGFAISSGSACSSRSHEPSHVLTALRVPPELMRGTVRLSFGRANSEDSARDLSRSLADIVESLRKLRSFPPK